MANKYNRSTFRFHFILIYMVAAFIGLAIIISSMFLFREISNRFEQYSSITEPIKYQIQAFNIDVNRQASYMQAYALSGDESLKEQANQLLLTKLPERIQTMQELAANLNDAGLEEKISNVALELTKLQKVSSNITYGQAAQPAGLIKEQYIPLLEASSLHLKELNAYLYEKHTRTFDQTFEAIDNGKYWMLAAFVLLLGVFYLVMQKTHNFLRSRILLLEMEISEIAKGNIPKELTDTQNELSPIIQAINYLLQNLRSVKEFSLRVGQGDFDSNISVFENQGELGSALAEMRQSLKDVSAEDKKRNWVNHGLAEFHNIIRLHNTELQELCYQVLSKLVKYVNANQGGIFILQEEEYSSPKLILEASYAYNRKKYQEKELEPGQSLVGQAYLEKDKIYLREIPQNYVHITSGLGEATPKTLYIQPLKNNEEVVGVLEIASFHELEDHVQNFIEKVCESLAGAVSTAKNNRRNSQILAESQMLTEQMRAQEEELRQNTEELQATQEEMQRLIRDLEAENQALKAVSAKN